MMRGLMFGLFIWIAVTLGIQMVSYLTVSEKMTLIKSMFYGLWTAIISVCIVAVIVVLF